MFFNFQTYQSALMNTLALNTAPGLMTSLIRYWKTRNMWCGWTINGSSCFELMIVFRYGRRLHEAMEVNYHQGIVQASGGPSMEWFVLIWYDLDPLFYLNLSLLYCFVIIYAHSRTSHTHKRWCYSIRITERVIRLMLPRISLRAPRSPNQAFMGHDGEI